MKLLNVVFLFTVLQLFLGGFYSIYEYSISTRSEAENQRKDKNIDKAALWNDKGMEYIKKKEYNSAIECFRKAVELDNSKMVYIINLAASYFGVEKFDDTQQLLNESINKFPQKKHQNMLQIALAEFHFLWAKNLEKKYDYVKAIKHYDMAYNIDKIHRPRRAAVALNNIGVMYAAIFEKEIALKYYEKALNLLWEVEDMTEVANTLNNIGRVYTDLGQKHKALEYYDKALQITQAVENNSGEANTLNNIGRVYDDLGDKQKALHYFEKSLNIRRTVGDRSGEAITLNNIGAVYNNLGQNEKALEYLEKALPIMREVGDRIREATTLSNIGLLYNALGQNHKALEYLKKALPIKKEVGDKEGEASTRNGIGRVYNILGEKQKALEYYEEALKICREINNPLGEAALLNNIGRIYNDLGDNHKALEYYQEALPITRVIKNITKEAIILNNIGTVYLILDQNQKALEYLEKALPLAHAVDDLTTTAKILSNIGDVYIALSQKQKALEYYEKTLPIRREVGDKAGEATTLNNIGVAYDFLGDKQKAMEYYEKALPIIRAVGDWNIEFRTYSNLMLLWESLKELGVAVFYGKQSINLIQKLRGNISGLEKKTQKIYLESNKSIYRVLADILITEGRISEAQQVLDMLKEQEYFEFIRRDVSYIGAFSNQIDFTKFEKQWLKKYDNIIEKLATISNEYHLLNFKKNKNKVEQNRLKELNAKLEKTTKAYEVFMEQMKVAFKKHEKKIKKGKIDPDILAKEANTLKNILKYFDKDDYRKNVVIHYLVYGSRISVILNTPQNQLVGQTEIDEKNFYQLVMNYRDYMLKSGKETRDAQPVDVSIETSVKRNPYGKILYDIIFKQVDEELKKYGATNLMISLDGVLRYIPFAALWDGESYLGQRYRIIILTPSSLKNIKDELVKERKILGLGASRGGHGFPPLPHVREEIKAIVNDREKGYDGLIKGKAFLDNELTKDTFVDQLKSQEFPLVHLSSHFKFSPGDETKNFLLLGDGNILKLSEIRRMGKLFDKVNLLVLSACQTGVGGNGEEIDGFGELAQQSGAKSVVASLWPVADESTKELMVTFYRKLKEGKVTSKIEALRQAQLELAGLEDLLRKDKQQDKKKTKYSHPYYWGAFIMMGNWR